MQYLWWFNLYLNSRVKNKVHLVVIQGVKQLEEQTGHSIYMDNLFTSATLLTEIRALGHLAFGTRLVKRGMPKCVEDIKKSVKAKSVLVVQLEASVCKQGDWVYVMCQNNNLLGMAWWDSGTCMFMSNCQDPVEKAVKRQKCRHVGQKDV